MTDLYADKSYYKSVYQGKVTVNIGNKLKRAQQHIDSLTFNRIVGLGFAKLTTFQQTVIKEVVCLQVDFEDENQEMLDSIMTSYSINGVSVNFGSNWNVVIQNGIAMQRSTYEILKQTGLTNRVIR
ncbi:hypothetical protein [Enterococcus sp. AZ109]|uniref:hypothetical protein n=1 Tax=Enterococcus sp. AZ109 TaxID=2774634 RepID=UPI003F1FFFC1